MYKRLMQKVFEIKEDIGIVNLILVIFYPVTLIVTTPIRLFQTLWNCRVLCDGKQWRRYPHFTPQHALLSFYYHTIALNIYRYGRAGLAPYLGLGNYRLSNLFHYALPSLYLYWKAGAVTLLSSMFIWWSSYFLWLDAVHPVFLWKIIVIILILFSTTFYSHTFACQNYNVVGWMFLPTIFYAWMNNNWMLAALACLGASFGSMTAVFLIFILSAVYSIEVLSLHPILTVIPATIKLLGHFWPNIQGGNLFKASYNIMKAIGFTRTKTKYLRDNSMRFGMLRTYRFLLYMQFGIILWYITGNISYLYIASFITWTLNIIGLRFADDQSLQITIVSVSAALMLNVPDQNIWLLISFWILISPLPLVFGFKEGKYAPIVPELRPIDIHTILIQMEKFLAPVKKGSKVLMAFNDPRNRYEKIFDKYRSLIDSAKYISVKNEFLFLPDWWGVFELNYEGAPDFWGRDIKNIERNKDIWQADYVIVYQETRTTLDKKWAAAGFKELNHFSGNVFEDFFNGYLPFSGPAPDWWLLSK